MKVFFIHIGNLVLASWRRLQVFGNLYYLVVVEVKAGNSIIRFGLLWFFFNGKQLVPKKKTFLTLPNNGESIYGGEVTYGVSVRIDDDRVDTDKF